MPSRHTFTIKPIAEIIDKYMRKVGGTWIDPFAGEHSPAEITNDLNPNKPTTYHLMAADFVDQHVEVDSFDGVLFDPPYSPRQISECYHEIGKKCSTQDTQNARLYSDTRNAIAGKIKDKRPVTVSFGWNSIGFGVTRGFEQIEIMMVCHGGAHNDTIVVVEQFTGQYQTQLFVK